MMDRRFPNPAESGSIVDRPPARTGRIIGAAVSGTVLVVFNLTTILCVLYAWITRPTDAYDEDILLGIIVSAFLGAILAFVTVLLTFIPVAAGWLSRWWYIVPALLLALALARWAHIEIVYPEEPELYMNLR